MAETLTTILIFGVAGLLAAFWHRRRRHAANPVGPASRIGFMGLGFIFGGLAGGLLGLVLGAAVVTLSPVRPPDEIAAYTVGPGIILGAFAGAFLGRWLAERAAARHRERELA